jgi:hypothetical protein
MKASMSARAWAYRAAIGLVCALPAGAQLGLGLIPMRTEMQMAPGAQHSGSLTLTNQTSVRTRVTAETLDFFIDAMATPQFQRNAAREAAYSCRQWLTLNPADFEAGPSGDVNIRYTINAPRDAAAQSYQCAAGFTTAPSAEKSGVTGIRTAVRIVAVFYVAIGKPKIDGTIKELRIEAVPDPKDPSKEPSWRAVAVIENRGVYYFRPSGTLDVLDESGKAVESVDFNPLVTLPKREQNYFFPLKNVHADGRYRLRVKVDLGGDEIQQASASVVAQLPSR